MSYFGTTDPDLDQAIRVVEGTYSVDISVVSKKKNLIKFGENPNVGSTGRYTIWYTGQDDNNETYVADNTNSIDTISCSTANAQVVRVEGHTMSGGDLTFVTQTATLNGTTKVTLGTALNRVTRVSHNQASATDLAGEVYVYEDTTISSGKPTDTTKIHLTVPSGENQSQKASTSISSTDYWIVTGISAAYLEKTGSNVTDVRLEARPVGGVFRPFSAPLVIKTGTTDIREYKPYVIVPNNHDVRLTANSSTTGQRITGDIQGYLASVIV